MSNSGKYQLDVPTDGLLATPTTRLPYQHNVLLRSFVLERPEGNAIIYNSPGVDKCAGAINDLGGATRLLVNHAHEAMYGMPHLDIPVYVHDRDSAETARSLPATVTFDRQQKIDDDLEVIPTPGHTAGTTSYLWDDGNRRFLFTGDFIWIEHNDWKAVVLDENLRDEYLDSLALVRDLDFDVLVPWGTTEDCPPYSLVRSANERRNRIDAIIDRVQAGGVR